MVKGDDMFKKILVPTDGSEVSRAAALEGVAFAAANNSEVQGVYVAPEYHYPVYIEIIPPTYPLEEEYTELMKKIGREYLQPIEEAAKKAGVKFHSSIVFSNSAAVAIVNVAQEKACDLIFMGSHGRSGLAQLVLGSVTSKVLSLCKIPVLVNRSKSKKA
jgi:nucleotide-binding universal stress UspA family protein